MTVALEDSLLTDADVIGTNLAHAIDLAQSRGWYPIFLHPRTKHPAEQEFYTDGVATLDPVKLNARHEQARERVERVERDRRTGFHHYRDPKTGLLRPNAKAASLYTDYTALDLNVGVYLGKSVLLAVDIDTPQEYDTWLAVCEHFGFDPGPPTVMSPGVMKNGGWKHRAGGHFYYDPPQELVDYLTAETNLNERISQDGLLNPKEAKKLGLELPALMGGKRFVIVPPSVRPEGPYVLGREHLDPEPLPQFLVEMLLRRKEAAEREAASRARRGTPNNAPNPRLIAWENTLDVSDLLDGWVVSGSDGECDILEHPDASTPKSATVHTPGCQHLVSRGIDTEHRMVTFFTINRPDWMTESKQETFTLASLYAQKFYDGNAYHMKRDLGLISGPQRVVTKRDADTDEWTTTVVTFDPDDIEPVAVETVEPITEPVAVNPTTTAVVESSDTDEWTTTVVTFDPQPAPVVVETVTVDGPSPEPVAPVVSDPEPVTVEPAPVTADTPQTPTAVVDTSETSDTYRPTAYTGTVPTWDESHPLNRLVHLLKHYSVHTPNSTWTHFAAAEVTLAGEPSPHLSENDRIAFYTHRKRTAASIHRNYRTVSTAQLAELMEVPPFRVQAWVRLLIPYMDTLGYVVRERENSWEAKQLQEKWDRENPTKKSKFQGSKFPTAAVNTHWMIYKKEPLA